MWNVFENSFEKVESGGNKRRRESKRSMKRFMGRFEGGALYKPKDEAKMAGYGGFLCC